MGFVKRSPELMDIWKYGETSKISYIQTCLKVRKFGYMEV